MIALFSKSRIKTHVPFRHTLELLAIATVVFPLLLAPAPCGASERHILRVKHNVGDSTLLIEILDDDLLHFELRRSADDFNPKVPLYTTPMVFKTDYAGPIGSKCFDDGTIETQDLKVIVDADTLAVTVIDKTRNTPITLTTIRPLLKPNEGIHTLLISPHAMQNVYGLGEQFITPGSADGDWVGRVRTPGHENGNDMHYFDEERGNIGNAQFPIMYAIGPATTQYALFVDDFAAQTWDFSQDTWQMKTSASPLRWYVMTGPDLPDLRADYMELTGHPPVPPKKMFGLWVSEFGYDNWAEMETKLTTLRKNAFPIDGFVLDLQWFGGIASDNNPGRMGSLSWDKTAFPRPARKIAGMKKEQGICIIPIEESYVVSALPEYETLKKRGYLVRKGTKDGPPADLETWWGKGGMVDWTNPAAADFWHDLKRQPLIEDGITGHWTDLGEPELYHPASWYHGFPEFDQHTPREVHNTYNFRWAQGLHRGYARHKVERRPFNMTRSGTSGIQRFGVGMWSGDIGSRMTQLATHLNVQMHMSMSGLDYFGSDIGGFQRWSLDGDKDELYTQWFANSSAFDVPVRPHTANCDNKYETAPDRIGDLKSNLANIRQRYELTPYLYSLAHRAYRHGEPMMPPLVFYYQNDPNVRQMGSEKLIGRDLLVASVTSYGCTRRDVYLPHGTWFNYHTNAAVDSKGEWIRDVPVIREGVFRLPMFARAGAIIPQMFVDGGTMNVMGKRTDDSHRNESIIRAYVGDKTSRFTLFEDDGTTIAYQKGKVRTTLITQTPSRESVLLTISESEGSYANAPVKRDNVVKLVVPNARACSSVTLNGKALQKHASRKAFVAAEQGWFLDDKNLVVAKSGIAPITGKKAFAFAFAKKAGQ